MVKRKPGSKEFLRYFSNTCSTREKRKIERWIHYSVKNRDLSERLKDMWELSKHTGEDWDFTTALRELTFRVENVERKDQFPKKVELFHMSARFQSPRTRIHFGLRIAAAIVALLGSFYFLQYLREQAEMRLVAERRKSFVIEEASTRPSQQVSLRFIDGTRIVLNSASRLRYSTDGRGLRNIYLEGEAYFEVVNSDNDPLTINTDDGTIRDIGTKFDVRAWPEDPNVKVAVMQGLVSLQPKFNKEKTVIVRAHEYSVMTSEGLEVLPTYGNVEKDLEWMRGKLVFQNEQLREIIKQVYRRFGLHCFVSDSSILSRRMTSTFDDHDPPGRVLNIIALSLRLRYKSSRDSVVFIPTRRSILHRINSESQYGRASR